MYYMYGHVWAIDSTISHLIHTTRYNMLYTVLLLNLSMLYLVVCNKPVSPHPWTWMDTGNSLFAILFCTWLIYARACVKQYRWLWIWLTYNVHTYGQRLYIPTLPALCLGTSVPRQKVQTSMHITKNFSTTIYTTCTPFCFTSVGYIQRPNRGV